MSQAYLLLGSNQGDRTQYLSLAIRAIGNLGTITKCSAHYSTQAWGLTEQPAFLNQALQLNTSLQPTELLDAILAIEKELGRERKQRYGPRTIDIDILLYEQLTVVSDRLTIPHPELPRRRFALVALEEIAAEVIHPELKLSIRDLLTQCADPLEVDKLVLPSTNDH
ncbi:MAG: 2-amino-4-hydroxy-6-hydroxymethyldihydropteridine diphosphokinase [Bacteroidota bacterium]